MDTGSTLTYVPCAGCGAGCGPHHQRGYDPRASSTSAAPACGSPACACGATACGCSAQGDVCTFAREYAEASSAAGAVVSDVARVPGWQSALTAAGDAAGAGGVALPPPALPRLTFGCATKETGEIKAQRAAGILGLGDATTGFAHQLAAAEGGGSAAFALCLGGGNRGGGGALILGRDLPPDAAAAVRGPTIEALLVASAGHPHYYAVALDGVSFGVDPLAVPASTFADGGHSAVLDSGTTFTYLPPAAFDAASKAIAAAADAAALPRVAAARGYGDACFGRLSTDAAIAATFPNMTLSFAGGAKLELGPGSYLFRHSDAADAVCVGLFAAPPSKGALLGAVTMRDMMVEFDAGARRVRMAAADCGAVGDVAREKGRASAASAAAPGVVSSQPRSKLVTGLAIAAPFAALAVGAGVAAAVAARRRAPPAAAAPPLPSPGSHKSMYRPMSADEDEEAAVGLELGTREKGGES